MRDVPAFRYVDGKLVACENYGPRMMAVVPQERPPLLSLPERRRDVGIMAADLEREARLPGGPPTWFAVNLSRRKRWAAWSRLSRRQREERRPRPLYERVETLVLDGHRFADGRGREALLYLPRDERPTDAHTRDLDRAMRAA